MTKLLLLLFFCGAAVAAPARVQSASNSSFFGTSNATVTVVVATQNTGGTNFIGGGIWRSGAGTLNTISDGTGGGTCVIKNPSGTQAGTDGYYVYGWYCYNITGGNKPTITATFSSNSDTWWITLTEVSGVTATDPVEATKFFATTGVALGTNHATTGNWTTITNGDFILGGVMDASFNTSVNTSGTASQTWTTDISITANGPGIRTEYGVQTTASASTVIAFTTSKQTDPEIWAMALLAGSPTVATPTFSPVGATFTSGIPVSVSITSGTVSAVICWRSDNVTPTAATPGTCDSPANTLTNGGSISVGATETVKAIGTLGGDINSSVASASYVISPTVVSWNGLTSGILPGTVGAINNLAIGLGAGQYQSWNGLSSPSRSEDNFIDFEGGTNGAAPTALTLGTSTHGTVLTWDVSTEHAGLTYATAGQQANLLGSVNVGGSNYVGSGTIGLQCTTAGAGNACGYIGAAVASSASMSVGFNISNTCPDPTSGQDCGAIGGLVDGAGGDYAVFHDSPGGFTPGLYLETHGATQLSAAHTARVAGAVYRVNIQMNGGASSTQRMTVCQVIGTTNPTYKFLGTVTSLTSVTGANPAGINIGFTGEEPAVNGYLVKIDNVVVSRSGAFSTTGCIL